MKAVGLSSPMHRWASLRSELLWIYDGPEQGCGVEVASDHRQGYWLWLLRSGSVTLTSGKSTLIAQKGQWIMSPNDFSRQQFAPKSRILSIHFRCEWPTGENLLSGTQGAVWDAALTPKLERSVLAIQKLAQRHLPRVHLELFLKSVSFPVFMRFQHRFDLFLADFADVMLSLGREFFHAGSRDQRVIQTIYNLREHPLHEAFPWDQLVRETGLSRRHIDRLMYAEFGMTAQSYWDHLKEERARTLIENTESSIKEIAYQLGFKQPSHFTKWFRQRTGWNPRMHRKLGARAIAQGSNALELR